MLGSRFFLEPRTSNLVPGATSTVPEKPLHELLADELAALPEFGRLLVAFSGGPDSSALLHATCNIDQSAPVIAIHVDHQLDPQSGARARAAAEFAAQLDVEYRNLTITVRNHGEGLEAAARRARYECLQAQMQAGDVLLTAHHADDQTETVMLRLMRASGPAALSAMQPLRRFGPGWLARPLLERTRAELEQYLHENRIRPQQDPGNLDLDRDRNFLRHRLFPLLAERWPGYREALLTAAALAGEAGEAQNTLADIDLASCGDGDSIDAAKLLRLDEPRRRALLRRWCAIHGAPPPPARRLATLLEQLDAPPDRHPEIRWSGWTIHRRRGRLYLLGPEE